MFSAEDVIEIYQYLSANGIQVWLTGGWGIDALLGKQTRPHKDLDVILQFDDLVRLRELLDGFGYRHYKYWYENLFVNNAHGNELATAFVLIDRDGRELDVHAFCFDDRGDAIPAWKEVDGFVFTKEDLEGIGRIAGVTVQCISAESQVVCHTGYELPEEQTGDLELLMEEFGLG
jgi:lincosamide nucleotidyltransferase A/C/D/E